MSDFLFCPDCGCDLSKEFWGQDFLITAEGRKIELTEEMREVVILALAPFFKEMIKNG